MVKNMYSRGMRLLLFFSIIVESTSYAMFDSRHEHYTQTKYNKKKEDNGLLHVLVPVASFFGAITGIYALGCWCGWWGNESDDQLLDRGQKKLNEVEYYRPLLEIVATAYKQDGALRQLHEPLLYELAMAKRSAPSIDAYNATLKACVYELNTLAAQMHKRSEKLKYDHDWNEIHGTCYHLDQLSSVLYHASRELEHLLSYVQAHTSYFKLFESEDYMRTHYAEPLHLLEYHCGDTYTLTHALRAHILSKYTGAFAIIDYVRKLAYDIERLDKLTAQLAYNYVTRIGYARDIVSKLYRIQMSIVSDPEYIRLLAEYERAQREKERLQLERERIQIERQKVEAREREARAREREARAQEEKNVLKAAELVEKHYRY